MPNRLANETSPYLKQHQNNPVDWYPWGEEAFSTAQRENKPVFLSVGYSSCHWCHVMEEESFEDSQVAEILNRSFISVKVDREERPDVDDAYMSAVQISTGRGGWPMSVFLTPDKNPFFAGTYFPKEDRGEYPSFRTVLIQIEAMWRTRETEVRQAADEFAVALREVVTRPAPGTFTKLSESFLGDSIQSILSDFDPEHGGFGSAPKFPPHTGIELLLGYALRSSASTETRHAGYSVALVTLTQMCFGGLHDHVGGGFHRYSTDAEWLLPHFEKMLYDNALMLGNLARASALSANQEELDVVFSRAMNGILRWVDEEMTSPEGLFYSSQDADSEGEEGRYYVWTKREIENVLGDRAEPFCNAFGVQEGGNFQEEATGQRTGANVLHLSELIGDQFDPDLARLREARQNRPRPALDDKAIVAWNGLMIGALAEAMALPMAERAAWAILEVEAKLGYVPHLVVGGSGVGRAFLEDYAYVADGLYKLGAFRSVLEENREELEEQGLTPDPSASSEKWISEAKRITSEMVERFYDPERPGFFGTTPGHEDLFGRTKPVFDQPMPSGNGIAIRCLIQAGDYETASLCLEEFIGWMERAPQSTESLLLDAVVLLPEEELTESLIGTALRGVSVTLESREISVNSDGAGVGTVLMQIPEGLHINSTNPAARWLTPTKIEIQPLKAQIEFPPAENDQYRGELRIPFKVSLPAGKKSEEIELRVSFQACTETECWEPKEEVLDAVLIRR